MLSTLPFLKEVVFERIEENGAASGKIGNDVVLSYGVLPGERAKVKILRKRKDIIEAEVVEIIEKSKLMQEPKEEHYLSCSPWQVFDYEFQIETKRNLLVSIFDKFAKEKIELNAFFKSPRLLGYRTKLEYGFLKENDAWQFSFFKRWHKNDKVALTKGCVLMDDNVQKKAYDILRFINDKKIEKPKSLILRKSFGFDDLHIALLVSQKQDVSFFNDFDFGGKGISGFIVSFSSPNSPASNFNEILWTVGREFLKEKILEKEFYYPYNAFFQNNIELFHKVLEIMRESIENCKKIVDLYCGVGVIGISLGDFAKSVYGVDLSKESIYYANLNAKLNNTPTFLGIALPDRKIDKSILDETDFLILDPPRAGIHPKLKKLILQSKPKHIFYLSCNPMTQAKDYFDLKNVYSLKKIYGFDFYPHTPHLESLILLEARS